MLKVGIGLKFFSIQSPAFSGNYTLWVGDKLKSKQFFAFPDDERFEESCIFSARENVREIIHTLSM